MKSSSSTPSIPYSIWALGSVSFFMKISAVIIYTISPLFITQVLGASHLVVGLLEGLLEGVTLFSRIFSGVLSDMIHKRKSIIAIGYVFALISRPLLALSTSVLGFFVAKTFDRIANGLDATPRDALVGDLAPPSIKGACYGLRESLSRAGAFSGALLVMWLLWIAHKNYSLIFWLGSIPAAIAFVVLLLFVKDTPPPAPQAKTNKKLTLQDILSLPSSLWLVLILSAVYNVSNFSGVFLILKAEQTGADLHLIPLVMVVQNIATTFTAYPAGYLSDKIGKRSMLCFGIFLVVCANLVLANATSFFVVLAGVFLWGAELGISQSMLSVLLADVCPASLRGTGFGLFHLLNGISLIMAHTLAGWLWSSYCPAYTFYASALIAGLTVFILPFIHKHPS